MQFHWVHSKQVVKLEENGYGVHERFMKLKENKHENQTNNTMKSEINVTNKRQELIERYDLHVDKTSWKKDNSSDVCSTCHDPFSKAWKWKHHCRKCGELVCDSCSKERVTIAFVGGNLRICDTCYKMKTFMEWAKLSVE